MLDFITIVVLAMTLIQSTIFRSQSSDPADFTRCLTQDTADCRLFQIKNQKRDLSRFVPFISLYHPVVKFVNTNHVVTAIPFGIGDVNLSRLGLILLITNVD